MDTISGKRIFIIMHLMLLAGYKMKARIYHDINCDRMHRVWVIKQRPGSINAPASTSEHIGDKGKAVMSGFRR